MLLLPLSLQLVENSKAVTFAELTVERFVSVSALRAAVEDSVAVRTGHVSTRPLCVFVVRSHERRYAAQQCNRVAADFVAAATVGVRVCC